MPSLSGDSSVTTSRNRLLKAQPIDVGDAMMDKVSKICILCRKEMKSPFDEFNASTVKSHYTFCYIAEGRFSEILSERGVNLTEEESKYYCP